MGDRIIPAGIPNVYYHDGFWVILTFGEWSMVLDSTHVLYSRGKPITLQSLYTSNNVLLSFL